MNPKLSRDDLVSLGARYRANYVIAQANYTLGVVAEDPDVKALVGARALSDLQADIRKLEDAVKDRDVAGVEGREATVAQGDALQAGKIWRRTLTRRALAALVGGEEIPADLGRVGSYGGNPQALARDLTRLADLARQNLAALASVGVNAAFLEKGSALAAQLLSVDQKQEIARLSRLPEKVRQMYEQKARVYLELKRVNYLGHSTHTEQAGQASRYNLDILYRRVRRPAADAPEIGAPAPASPTTS